MSKRQKEVNAGGSENNNNNNKETFWFVDPQKNISFVLHFESTSLVYKTRVCQKCIYIYIIIIQRALQ